MKIFSKIMSLLLCLSLCLSVTLPAMAAGTVSLVATLDQQALTVSEESQTVTLTIQTAAPVSTASIEGKFTWPSGWTLNSITNTEDAVTFTDANLNDAGKISWKTADVETVTISNVAVAVFTIPANTAAGTYTLGIEGVELTENYGDILLSNGSASATLTIQAGDTTNPSEPVVPAEGYTIALSTLTPSPVHETTFDVDVAITHSEATETDFAAGQFQITYDHTALTLNSITPKQQGSNMTTNTVAGESATTLKVADFGSDKLLGSGVYTLNFTAKTAGNTTLTLSDAGFTTQENATVKDLEAASCGADLIINVLKKTFTVTLPDYGFTSGSTTITDGEAFTFRISDPYYDYGTVYTSVDGGAPVALAPNADGSYTIPAVTGNVTITTEKKEARSYSVTIHGDYESGAETATYMADYQFTLKADKTADATNGYTYSVESITIGGAAYTNYTAGGRTYTIPGQDIKGDIVITIKKTESNPAYVFVTYLGHPGSVQNPVATIPYGSDYTLTLAKISGYHYTVTATMGGNEAAVVDNGDGTYTIKNVTGALVITITRTVNTDGVSVTHYLTLNGSDMYLILKDPAESNLDANYIPTYNGNAMYWSGRYNAYCYLIISDKTIVLDEEKAKIELAELSDTVTKIEVPYDMDVNLTGKVDAADAQLVYNMYSNPTVTEFTEDLSMLKFLKADVVSDGNSSIVDTNDAVAIINYIIGINAAQ